MYLAFFLVDLIFLRRKVWNAKFYQKRKSSRLKLKIRLEGAKSILASSWRKILVAEWEKETDYPIRYYIHIKGHYFCDNVLLHS